MNLALKNFRDKEEETELEFPRSLEDRVCCSKLIEYPKCVCVYDSNPILDSRISSRSSPGPYPGLQNRVEWRALVKDVSP